MTRPLYADGVGTSPRGPAGQDGTDGIDGADGLPGVNAIPAREAVDAYTTDLLDDPDSAFKAKQAEVTGEVVVDRANPVKVDDGDSITAGVNGIAAYPTYSNEGLADGSTLYNFGVPGQYIDDMQTDAATQVDTKFQAGRLNICSAMGGKNNVLRGDTAASIYAKIRDYHLARRAAGFKTIAWTITPSSSNATGSPTDNETVRIALNTLIRNGWTTFADAFADIGADPIMGDIANTTNPLYYADLIHPAPAGYRILARYQRRAMRALGVAAQHTHALYAEKATTRTLLAPALAKGTSSSVAVLNGDSALTTWDLTKAGPSNVTATVDLPADWSTYRLSLILVNRTGSTGAVRIIYAARPTVVGTATTAEFPPGENNWAAITVPGSGAPVRLDLPSGAPSLAVTPGAISHGFYVIRDGSDGGDTLAGAVGVAAVVFTKIT